MGGSAGRCPSPPTRLDDTEVDIQERGKEKARDPKLSSLPFWQEVYMLAWWHGFSFIMIERSGIITIAFYRDNSQHWSSLLPTAAASREVDSIPSLVVCPLKGAGSTASPACFRKRSAEYLLSFLGAWCWRMGEQSLTAPRRQDAFGTQGGPLCQLEGLSGFIQYSQHTEG